VIRHTREIVKRGDDHIPADGDRILVRVVHVGEFSSRVHHIAVFPQFMGEPARIEFDPTAGVSDIDELD
jgi:hypothetical protein